MSIVLAAIDNSAAARPVLEAARSLAGLLGAEIETVHVEDTGMPRTAATVSSALHLLLHRRRGDVATEIAATAHERDAVLVVVGARGVPSGASPAGHVTMELIQALDLAVVVVPPDAKPRPVARLLVAVEGDGESHALRRVVRDLLHRPDIEVVALHVFEPDQLPMFGDQPVLEAEAWTTEFARRVLRTTERKVQVEMRVGNAGTALLGAARELDADVVAIGWHRDLTHGHARLVREVLAKSDIPLLLTPIPRSFRAAAP